MDQVHCRGRDSAVAGRLDAANIGHRRFVGKRPPDATQAEARRCT
jgi:hypothetical protein